MRASLLVALTALFAAAQAGAVTPGAPDRVVQVFSEDGRLLSQTFFKDGRKTGRHVMFWEDGSKRVETTFVDDRIEGEYRAWHRNGRPAQLKHYALGQEAGMQQAWTDTGELYVNAEVRNGRHYGLVNSRPCLPVEGASKGEM